MDFDSYWEWRNKSSMLELNFLFTTFSKEHYPIYQSWFSDAVLQKALGKLDKEWLNYVLTDKSGTEWAVFEKNQLIAVIGVTHPIQTHNYYVISNIAINPTLKRQGLGSKILQLLLQQMPLKKGQYWVSYVEPDNTIAQQFFIKNNWINKGIVDGMFQYEQR